MLDGNLVADAAVQIPIFFYLKPGVMKPESDDFHQTDAQAVKSCIQDYGVEIGKVTEIAFDSKMAGISIEDEDFNSVTRFDSWLDMGCQLYIKYFDKNHRDLVNFLTGCPPTGDHGPKILRWKEEKPEAYKHIAKFGMPADYVAGKMVISKDENAFMDYTFIHFSGFGDAQKVAGRTNCLN